MTIKDLTLKLEAVKKKAFDKTIALVAGSYKPPHAAHFLMVQHYAKIADEVVVLISDPKAVKSIRKTNLGTVITPQMSKQIWDVYIKRYGLKNVVAEVSTEASPITAMFKYVDDNLSDVNVIFGVSKKGGDEQRFKSAMRYYEDNPNINLLDPVKTAVEPFASPSGVPISATDIRNNIDKPEVIRPMLPDKLTDQDIQKIMQILGAANEDVNEDTMVDELIQKKLPFDKLGIDEDEELPLNITDEALGQAKILCYNIGQQVVDQKGKDIPVNPKKFPDKAIDIKFIADGHQVEVWLDTESKEWMSSVDGSSRLSLEQFGQFFSTQFYMKLAKKLIECWPMSDELYGGLFLGVANKKVSVTNQPALSEDEENDKKREERLKQKKKDKEKAERRYSPSGRKLIKFGDIGVIMSSAKFFCWPDKKKLYRWSTWKDWKKIKPICRLRFKHTNGKEYGMSLSCIGEMYEHRGFRGYDLTTQPTLQWLSKDEMQDFIKLSIVQKFISHCAKRIQEALDIDTDEIYEKINNPDKITKVEIEKTKEMVRKTLQYIIKKKQLDDFVWK